ncbi:MAG: isocitrate/isopropylmalate family dehydrogenase [Solirubrobacterales bacterium]
MASGNGLINEHPRLRESVVDAGARVLEPAPLIGVLPGEGIGPEVIEAAVEVSSSLGRAGGEWIAIEVGGPIGRAAEDASGTALTADVVRFCRQTFARGGAILSGPGGGRYVYDLRRELGLYLKATPVRALGGLRETSPLRPEATEGLDLLLVRENLGGVYQGSSEEVLDRGGGRAVRHVFSYDEADVSRFLDAAARLARARRGELTVVIKESGIPAVSTLWRDCAEASADAHGIAWRPVDVDLMAYELVRAPGAFDVVAAPNLCGDVLGDLAAALVGTRAMSFSGSFTRSGEGVYQTNHGAAHDIAGSDRANPIGQILSLAMLLRESLGLEREARAVEEAVRRVWTAGHRTVDVDAGGEAIGTREMAELVAGAAADALRSATAAPV